MKKALKIGRMNAKKLPEKFFKLDSQLLLMEKQGIYEIKPK